MSTKSITGTGLLLAVALLAQSLRLIFPFIPNQVSMFLIGSITSATFVLATWRYGWRNGLVIAWIAPVVAHLQGMLPLPPFASIPVPAPSMPSLPSLLAFLLEEHAAIAITGRAIISPFSTLFSCISMIPLVIN